MSVERRDDHVEAPVGLGLRIGIARQVAHLAAEHKLEDFLVVQREADIGLTDRRARPRLSRACPRALTM